MIPLDCGHNPDASRVTSLFCSSAHRRSICCSLSGYAHKRQVRCGCSIGARWSVTWVAARSCLSSESMPLPTSNKHGRATHGHAPLPLPSSGVEQCGSLGVDTFHGVRVDHASVPRNASLGCPRSSFMLPMIRPPDQLPFMFKTLGDLPVRSTAHFTADWVLSQFCAWRFRTTK